MVGVYDATLFEVDNLDQLSRGAAMTITLADEGSTRGRLWLPGGAGGCGDLDVDLTGSWDFDARFQTLTLHPDQESFLRGMSFLVRREAGIDGTIELYGGRQDMQPMYNLRLTRR